MIKLFKEQLTGEAYSFMMMTSNCFCITVDQQKTLSLIFSTEPEFRLC